jgi:hypothetical protein
MGRHPYNQNGEKSEDSVNSCRQEKARVLT